MNQPIERENKSPTRAPDGAPPVSRSQAPLRARLVLAAGIALLGGFAPAFAQTVPLGTASPFGVLAASAVSNTGASVVLGDLGIHPNNASSVTGFPPGQIIGVTHFADAVAEQAQLDVTTAYNNLAGRPCGTVIGADLGGTTLFPGVYCSTSTMGLTGILTLDAQGDPDAEFIFKVGSALTTGSNAMVRMINGGQNCNVYWQVGSSATLGTGTSFVGNVLALASITLTTGANASGRLLARTGAVTLDTSAVTICALAGNAPALSKEFTPSSINSGGVSTLTITLSNPNPTVATLTAPLVDTLPLGVVVAPIPDVGTTCGGVGVPLANAGGTTVTLPAGRSVPGKGSCTLTVNVTAAANGVYINTLPAGALVTSNGNNAAPAVATLTVIGLLPPPTLGKAFNPSTIDTGGVSTLTVTLSNPNPAIATLLAPLVDTLPLGVVVAAIPNVATTCGGVGTPLAVAGGSSATLPAGRTIPANGSCTLSVDVTAALPGTYVNTLVAGALVTSNGNNPSPAVATLTVLAIGPTAPAISKSFNPSTINAGGISTLTITLSNPNPAIATLAAPLVDTLPNGVVVAAIPNLATTCGGAGAPVAVAGGSTVTLPAGRSIPANGSCTVTVDVTAALGGAYINTIVAGALVTSNGNNPAPAIATLTVVSAIPPPFLGKSFNPASIDAGGVSTLTITLSNPSAQIATLTAPLVDPLPAGVVIAPAPNLGTTCTGGNPPVASAGGSTVTLPAGNSIPANGSCSITVSVTAAAAGAYVNTLLAGALSTSNGINPAPAIATLTVIAVIPPPPPVIPHAAVPTLSTLGLLLLSASLMLAGFAAVRLRTT